MKKLLQIITAIILVVTITGCSSETKAGNRGNAANQVKLVNWRRPSETKPYPKITHANKRYIWVSIARQRVYIMSPDKRILYTMYASTGKDNATPKGTFHIQQQRGNFFYNQRSKEGAHYWTSWKDHGVYLFHTVPTNAKGQYIKSEAKTLGIEPDSHGCIRLSIPDAKWINRTVPVGTKVVIN
ncbi:L,D-transpeptidase [Lentilactobacillus kisonensis]|nr:L,D-transpeptidase [Lentilactobacillus kisonensis]